MDSTMERPPRTGGGSEGPAVPITRASGLAHDSRRPDKSLAGLVADFGASRVATGASSPWAVFQIQTAGITFRWATSPVRPPADVDYLGRRPRGARRDYRAAPMSRSEQILLLREQPPERRLRPRWAWSSSRPGGTRTASDKTKMDIERWSNYDAQLGRLKDNRMIAQPSSSRTASGKHGSLPEADKNRLFRYLMARTSAFSHMMYVICWNGPRRGRKTR